MLDKFNWPLLTYQYRGTIINFTLSHLEREIVYQFSTRLGTKYVQRRRNTNCIFASRIGRLKPAD